MNSSRFQVENGGLDSIQNRLRWDDGNPSQIIHRELTGSWFSHLEFIGELVSLESKDPDQCAVCIPIHPYLLAIDIFPVSKKKSRKVGQSESFPRFLTMSVGMSF